VQSTGTEQQPSQCPPRSSLIVRSEGSLLSVGGDRNEAEVVDLVNVGENSIVAQAGVVGEGVMVVYR
jgi:hypothetical protein